MPGFGMTTEAGSKAARRICWLRGCAALLAVAWLFPPMVMQGAPDSAADAAEDYTTWISVSSAEGHPYVCQKAPSSTSRCGGPPWTMSSDGTKCLMRVDVPASYMAAQLDCALRGGGLACVRDEVQNSDVRQICAQMQACFIGLRRNERNQWAWEDGTPMTYSNWMKGEPSGGPGDKDAAALGFVSVLEQLGLSPDLAVAVRAIVFCVLLCNASCIVALLCVFYVGVKLKSGSCISCTVGGDICCGFCLCVSLIATLVPMAKEASSVLVLGFIVGILELVLLAVLAIMTTVLKGSVMMEVAIMAMQPNYVQTAVVLGQPVWQHVGEPSGQRNVGFAIGAPLPGAPIVGQAVGVVGEPVLDRVVGRVVGVTTFAGSPILGQSAVVVAGEPPMREVAAGEPGVVREVVIGVSPPAPAEATMTAVEVTDADDNPTL